MGNGPVGYAAMSPPSPFQGVGSAFLPPPPPEVLVSPGGVDSFMDFDLGGGAGLGSPEPPYGFHNSSGQLFFGQAGSPSPSIKAEPTW